MKTETVLETIAGQRQFFRSEADMLNHYNRDGRHYILKAGRLIHKGHNMLVGRVSTITTRGDEVAV